uniref:DB domain-containing protein n=1 Tax=Bursaphelenchus xylophilus TaxID=6326 RepID=A0A1I7RT46_BURXY
MNSRPDALIPGHCYDKMPSRLLYVFIFSLVISYGNCQVAEEDYDENADDDKPPRLAYDPAIYSSTARDFTGRCMKLAQYSGEKACDVFELCCSTDNVLSKLNGDKCQFADPTNGCSLDISGNKIQWSQCRAYNCTEEITTTTTTTQSPRYSNSSPVRVGMSILLLFAPLVTNLLQL